MVQRLRPLANAAMVSLVVLPIAVTIPTPALASAALLGSSLRHGRAGGARSAVSRQVTGPLGRAMLPA